MSIIRRRPHTNTTSNVQSDSVHQEYLIQEAPKDAQVIMIIKMPSPTKPQYHRAHSSGHTRRSSHYSFLSNSETLVENTSRIQEDLLGTHHDSGQFQYSIGVHTCSWPFSTNFPTKNNDVGRIPHSHAEKEFGWVFLIVQITVCFLTICLIPTCFLILFRWGQLTSIVSFIFWNIVHTVAAAAAKWSIIYCRLPCSAEYSCGNHGE